MLHLHRFILFYFLKGVFWSARIANVQCLLICLFGGRVRENNGGMHLPLIAPPRMATMIWWWSFSIWTLTSSSSSLPYAESAAWKPCGTTRNTSRTSRNAAHRLPGIWCWNARQEEHTILSFAPATAGGYSTLLPRAVTWISLRSCWGSTLLSCLVKESMESLIYCMLLRGAILARCLSFCFVLLSRRRKWRMFMRGTWWIERFMLLPEEGTGRCWNGLWGTVLAFWGLEILKDALFFILQLLEDRLRWDIYFTLLYFTLNLDQLVSYNLILSFYDLNEYN